MDAQYNEIGYNEVGQRVLNGEPFSKEELKKFTSMASVLLNNFEKNKIYQFNENTGEHEPGEGYLEYLKTTVKPDIERRKNALESLMSEEIRNPQNYRPEFRGREMENYFLHYGKIMEEKGQTENLIKFHEKTKFSKNTRKRL